MERRGHGGGGRGRLYIYYTYHNTVTTRMTPALRWAAIRAVLFLMFHSLWGTKSNKPVSTDHNFWREKRAEADSNQGPSAYQPSALLLLLGQTGSQKHLSAVSTTLNSCQNGPLMVFYFWITHVISTKLASTRSLGIHETESANLSKSSMTFFLLFIIITSNYSQLST